MYKNDTAKELDYQCEKNNNKVLKSHCDATKCKHHTVVFVCVDLPHFLFEASRERNASPAGVVFVMVLLTRALYALSGVGDWLFSIFKT